MRRAFALSLGLTILALVTLLIAAGAQARPKAVTITLSGWSSGTDEDTLLQSVVNTFNRTHPNINVNYAIINGDYSTAMTARFAAHNPPDVFYVDSSVAPTWAQQGVLQPLNSYIKASKYNITKFYPGLLNAFKVGKTYYGTQGSGRRHVRGPSWRRTPRNWQLRTSCRAGSRSAFLRTGRECSRSSTRTRVRSRTSSQARSRRP